MAGLAVSHLKGDSLYNVYNASSGKNRIVFGEAIATHLVELVHVAAQRGRWKRTSRQEIPPAPRGPNRAQKDRAAVH